MAAPLSGTVEAQLLLGELALRRGDGEGAYAFFRAAARSGAAPALNMLARAHQMGWGVPVDVGRAAGLYRQAADRGDAWALFNLADLHAQGLGVPRCDAAAAALYAAAARAGHAKALNMLGLLLEDGRGVAQDALAARACFERGAEAGDCWAMLNLGRRLLEEGDRARAVALFEASLDHGFPEFRRVAAAWLRAAGEPAFEPIAARADAMERRAAAGGADACASGHVRERERQIPRREPA